MGLVNIFLNFQRCPNYPWTPKPRNMKVLHPKIWVITPKNEGFGFPWYPALVGPAKFAPKKWPSSFPTPKKWTASPRCTYAIAFRGPAICKENENSVKNHGISSRKVNPWSERTLNKPINARKSEFHWTYEKPRIHQVLRTHPPSKEALLYTNSSVSKLSTWPAISLSKSLSYLELIFWLPSAKLT